MERGHFHGEGARGRRRHRGGEPDPEAHGFHVGDATVNVRAIGAGTASFGNNSDLRRALEPQPADGSAPERQVLGHGAHHGESGSPDYEGLETLVFQLENPSGAAVGPLDTTTLKITDEEPTVQFSLSAYTVTEPKSGTPVNFVITVKRTGKLTSGTNVDVATSDLTATAGLDYTAVPLTTLNFAANASTKTFTVPILPDVDDEVDEKFRVTLSNPAAGSLGTPIQADVTIKDNDTAGKLQFQVAVSSVSEDAGTVDLVVTRTGGTGLATVNYDAVSGLGTGGANSGTDFDVTTGTLTFNPGENSKTITINITPDALVEGGRVLHRGPEQPRQRGHPGHAHHGHGLDRGRRLARVPEGGHLRGSRGPSGSSRRRDPGRGPLCVTPASIPACPGGGLARPATGPSVRRRPGWARGLVDPHRAGSSPRG